MESIPLSANIENFFQPIDYQKEKSRSNASPACPKKNVTNLKNLDGNNREVVYQKKENNVKKAKQVSNTNRTIASSSVKDVTNNSSSQNPLLDHYYRLIFSSLCKDADNIQFLPPPFTSNRDPRLDDDDYFSSLEERVLNLEKKAVTKEKAAQLSAMQKEINPILSFLKNATPEEQCRFNEIIQIMNADFELFKSKRQDKSRFQKKAAILKSQKKMPLAINEKTPAETFALTLLNDVNFLNIIKQENTMNTIVKQHIVPLLMEEGFLKPHLETQVKNLTVEDVRKGIQNKVNNILIRGLKNGSFSNEKYEGKANARDLKIIDMYNAVFDQYNRFLLLDFSIK